VDAVALVVANALALVDRHSDRVALFRRVAVRDELEPCGGA
jgi:hypothetical protein